MLDGVTRAAIAAIPLEIALWAFGLLTYREPLTGPYIPAACWAALATAALGLVMALGIIAGGLVSRVRGEPWKHHVGVGVAIVVSLFVETFVGGLILGSHA